MDSGFCLTQRTTPCARGYAVNLKTLGLTKLLLYMVPALVGTYTKAAKSKRLRLFTILCGTFGFPGSRATESLRLFMLVCMIIVFHDVSFFGIMFILIFNFEQRISFQSAGSFSPAPMSLGCWLASLLFIKQLDLKKIEQRWVLASSFLNCCSHVME